MVSMMIVKSGLLIQSYVSSFSHATIFISDKYALTFRATGCKNNDPDVDWWKSQADGAAFADMMTLCTLTYSGSASSEQKEKCCGTTYPDCKPSSCVLQTQFTEGNYKKFLILSINQIIYITL